jgi:hypothetical protein
MLFASKSLAARIERAECRLLADSVRGSKSQENVQRRGFELLYTRAVLVRSATG